MHRLFDSNPNLMEVNTWMDLCVEMFLQDVLVESVSENFVKSFYLSYMFPQIKIEKTSWKAKFQNKILELPFYQEYQKMAQDVLCHKSKAKYKILYRFFIKAVNDPSVLLNSSDDDYKALKDYRMSVIKDYLAMQDRLKFYSADPKSLLVWSAYIPCHYILHKALNGFLAKKENWIIFSSYAEIGSVNGSSFYKLYDKPKSYQQISSETNSFLIPNTNLSAC